MSRISQIPGQTTYVDEIEKLYPCLTDGRNSRLFRKNEFLQEQFILETRL